MIYMLLLFSSILLGACVRDIIDDVPVPDEDNEIDKKDVVLVRMGTDDAEVKDITSRLFNNIPTSWEIGKKTIVDYDKMTNPETELDADIKNPDIYVTVILNIKDVVFGKYPVSLFRMLKFYKRDFYVIATQDTPEQKNEMLSLIGVYMEPNYYAINYDNVQHYRIFPSADPYAKNNMIGKGAASFNQQLLTRSADILPKGTDSDPAYNAQMADKEALKQIEIYNRIYGYAQAMTPNYVTWGGWTLRQNYLNHINNSMKLHQQQCIYSLESDAQPGVVSVAITDAIDLQKTYVHYNCGIRYGHDSARTDLKMSKMVWIDFRQWDN